MTRVNPKELISTQKQRPCCSGKASARKKNLLILVLEGISNSHAKTGGTWPAEFDIVVDEIEMGFRTHENAGRQIEAHPAADVGQEVVAADKICAPTKVARKKRLVKTDAFPPDSTL